MVGWDYSDVVLKPLVSEKGTYLAEKNCFLFQVHKYANKKMVKEALETMFSVKIKTVNILNQKGKEKINPKTRRLSHGPIVRKAYVTLREGRFPFLETMN